MGKNRTAIPCPFPFVIVIVIVIASSFNVGAADGPQALCEPIGESEAATMPRFRASLVLIIVIACFLFFLVPAGSDLSGNAAAMS